MERLETGTGQASDIDAILGWLGHVADGSRCYLATEERIIVDSILRALPDEFDGHIALGHCPRPRRLPIPKLVDLGDERATQKRMPEPTTSSTTSSIRTVGN